MSQPDLLDDLLTTDPNEPASKAVVLLLRADMKSEFKSVRSDIGRIEKRMEHVEENVAKLTCSLDMVAEQVSKLTQSLDAVGKQVAFIAQRTR